MVIEVAEWFARNDLFILPPLLERYLTCLEERGVDEQYIHCE